MTVARVARQRRRRRQQHQFSAPRFLRWSLAVIIALVGVVVLAVLIAAGAGFVIYRYYAQQLPPPQDIIAAEEDAFLTTELYDRTGQNVIYEVIDPLGGDRRWVGIDDIPQYFLDATVSIEDARFYANPGFDLEGMGRALWSNLTGGQVQGASTITQQLVRGVLMTPEERITVSMDRKVKEVILATEISRLYSKDQILEWYVNTNFYGNLAYGVEAASQLYFGKPARDLTLAEAALLAAIPQFPLQNPIDNPDSAKLRQEIVLNIMAEQGYITRDQADAAAAESIAIRPYGDQYSITAPHFSIYARAEAESLLNDLGLDGARLVTRGGLRIYTTLDVDLQLQAECVARSHVQRLDGGDPGTVVNTAAGMPCTAANYLPAMDAQMIGVDREVSNAASVVLRGDTGEILALVGSVDYWNTGIDGNYNAALAQRQPASAFKPIVYTAAFLAGGQPGYPNGITAATMTYDVPIEFDNGGEPYTPVNIDRQYHGPMSVRDALANSYNVPPVQLTQVIGLGPVVRTAHRLGVNSLNRIEGYGLALALGSGEASLLDMTYVYNVFNTGGYMVGTPVHEGQSTPGFRTLNPVSVLRIEDADGTVLWEYGQETNMFQRRLVLEPAVAYIMTDMLADSEARAPAFGANNPLDLSRRAAVKTGTSNDNRDSWTIGYTPQIVTGVWVGNNNNHSMVDVTGESGAAPIWHAIMEYALARDAMPVQDWARPSTVVEQMVCQISGLLPTRSCPQTRELFYVDQSAGISTVPTQTDTYWKTYSVNVCSGNLATSSSPADCVEDIPYFDYPPETLTWARETGQRLPPTEYDTVDAAEPSNPVTILSPVYLARVGGVVEVRGNVEADNLSYWELDYGAGTQPDVWQQIGENGTVTGSGIVLGLWDTAPLSSGAVYTLRLQMVRSDGSLETAFVSVTIDNQPPTVTLSAPAPDSTYSATRDSVVTLEAQPEDDVQIAAVEFYVDGELVATTEEWPHTTRWSITGQGQHDVWAVAFDAAGNSTESAHATITVGP
jgi:membrane peptidoglycan carboxypeptidase